MAEKPTLIYFDARGRAELIRFILAYAEVDFEDQRITDKEWIAMKPKTIFNQLPIYTFDETTFCQSLSIARFLAKKHGLVGTDELEEAKCDMIVDCVEETVKNIFLVYFEKDEETKAKMLNKFENETLPRHMGLFEKLLQPKENENNFFVGEQLTWADISFLTLKDYLSMINVELSFAKYPAILSFIDQIAAVPNIAAWIAKRPVTDF